MNVNGRYYRTIWAAEDGAVEIIDQARLPHEFAIARLHSLDDAARAITVMQVRGAPLIGATAAWGIALAMLADPSDAGLERACTTLLATRPTAVNLRWAVDRVRARLAPLPTEVRADTAHSEAAAIGDEDVASNRLIGRNGFNLIRERYLKTNDVVNIMTHCNAGWLATVDGGTALAPVYAAFDIGVPLHVWVSETRPRNQGASLTAWELAAHGVPHTIIADNAAGHFMQRRQVDMVIVGADRVTRSGDVANKIGTYLKALAAAEHGVAFYVAFPSSTVDWDLDDGIGEIPIEERTAEEVTYITGLAADGLTTRIRLAAAGSPATNPAFDVTPARFVTNFVTERGVCEASSDGLLDLFPEYAP